MPPSRTPCGVPMYLANQGARRLPVDAQLDDGARRHVLEEPAELTRVQRQGLGVARVPVDDAGDLAAPAERSRGALSGARPRARAQGCSSHTEVSLRCGLE